MELIPTHIILTVYVFIDLVLKEVKCGYTQALYPIEVQWHPISASGTENHINLLITRKWQMILLQKWMQGKCT